MEKYLDDNSVRQRLLISTINFSSWIILESYCVDIGIYLYDYYNYWSFLILLNENKSTDGVIKSGHSIISYKFVRKDRKVF